MTLCKVVRVRAQDISEDTQDVIKAILELNEETIVHRDKLSGAVEALNRLTIEV
jgi:hypothetical protein